MSQFAKDILINKAISLFNEGSIKKSLKDEEFNPDFCVLKRSEFFTSNWFEGIRNSRFDIILCNPPYISREDETSLPDEVLLFDPEHALFSDKNGLADYEKIFFDLSPHLTPDGIFLLEIGYNQLEHVLEMVPRSDLRVCDVFQDLRGIPRCLILCHVNNTVL